MARTKAPSFDDFWKAYPLHRGRLDAEKAWASLSATDKSRALVALPRYRDYCRQTGIGIKYPHGWLNGRRWEDEYDEPAVASGTKTEQSATPPSAAGAFADMETW